MPCTVTGSHPHSAFASNRLLPPSPCVHIVCPSTHAHQAVTLAECTRTGTHLHLDCGTPLALTGSQHSRPRPLLARHLLAVRHAPPQPPLPRRPPIRRPVKPCCLQGAQLTQKVLASGWLHSMSHHNRPAAQPTVLRVCSGQQLLPALCAARPPAGTPQYRHSRLLHAKHTRRPIQP